MKEEAYQPNEARKAPPHWPGRQPGPPTWWRAFVTARPGSSADRDEAALLLLDFDTHSQQNRRQRSLAWAASRLVAPIGAGAGLPALSVYLQQALDLYGYELATTTPLNVDQNKPTLETLAFAQRMNYLLDRDDAPPEYLWLAIRAARRALHDNPDDAHAYLILGEMYLRLLHGTRERVWQTRLPLFTRMRQVQASAALNQALIVQPDLLPAHDSLSLLYQDMGLWDLSLKHRREVLRLARAQPRTEGESDKEHENRLARLREEGVSQSRAAVLWTFATGRRLDGAARPACSGARRHRSGTHVPGRRLGNVSFRRRSRFQRPAHRRTFREAVV